ncbi:MAG: dockerin type I repeat-containing protein [Ruminococcus sp.]
MKKLISLALCAVMAAGSAVCANAAERPAHKGVKILNSTILVENNTLKVYANNIVQSNTGGIMMKDEQNGKEYSVNFADCISGPKTLTLPSAEEYRGYLSMDGSASGSTYHNFENTGGEYVKVKIRLSDINPNYFNSDGTHTKNGHNYKFTFEKTSDGYYDSVLYFVSGGVVTGVTPNNGYASIYISTNVGDITEYSTNYSYRTETVFGSGGGANGLTARELIFGNMDFDYSVNVNDVTALQQYLAGEMEFDTLQYFYADINRDGIRNVTDVTALQTAISE